MRLLSKKLGNNDLKDELRHNRYYRPISNLQKEIHSKIENSVFDIKNIASFDIRYEYFNGIFSKRAVIYLLSNGCEWAIKSAHGCTMCGHIAKQVIKDNNIVAADFIKQFESAYNDIDFKDIPILSLFNNGSFLNEREIPNEALIEILSRINSNPDIKMVVLETRPEFVNEEKIKQIKELLSNKYVEIAIGLELKNDLYRRICLNKGFSLKMYEKAAKIIVKHLNLRSYVFLKPILLSEKESYDQLIETIKYAFKIGNACVSLEACTIQDFTLTSYLYDQNMYSPPWLWSIVEAVKECHNLGKLTVGMFKFYPSPSKVPYNCDKCSPMIMEKLKEYNENLKIDPLLDLDCSCKQEWLKEMNKEVEPFDERLSKLISEIKI